LKGEEMKRQSILVLAVVCVMTVVNIASAEIIRGIDIDFVTIGNPGNPGDTRTNYPDSADPYGCGAVAYEYRIGKYEVTNEQWDAFVSEAGAPTGNPSNAYDESAYWTGTDVPTNNVSWYEAAQFCNYLTSGDKSLGAYQFSNGDFTGIDRTVAIATYSIIYVLPTEDEWYKAAYYTGSGYSTYANGQESIPAADNGWNYQYGAYDDEPWDVGTGTMEQNGTFDIMGNVWEWNETMIASTPPYRGFRGGSYADSDELLRSAYRYGNDPYNDYSVVGFRVASIPEPSTLLLLGLGVIFLKRKR
jgi:formylglycine-generating enzyme required for sulfatase activity